MFLQNIPGSTSLNSKHKLVLSKMFYWIVFTYNIGYEAYISFFYFYYIYIYILLSFDVPRQVSERNLC